MELTPITKTTYTRRKKMGNLRCQHCGVQQHKHHDGFGIKCNSFLAEEEPKE